MKIIHIDDHTLFAEGLQALLSDHWDNLDYLIATNLKDGKRLIASQSDASLILLDLALPGGDGIHILEFLRIKELYIPVVVLSAINELPIIQQAVEKGAIGYISKAYTGEEMLRALQIVLSGEPYIPAYIRKYINRKRKFDPLDQMSIAQAYGLKQKQLEILNLLAKGLSNAKIADALELSIDTVKYHLKVLFNCLGVSNRIECLQYAMLIGLIKSG